MSDEIEKQSEESAEGADQGAIAQDAERTAVQLGYNGLSQITTGEGTASLALCSNTHRSPVRAVGTVHNPLRMREALSAIYEIVKSDHRYIPRDRTAYLAYQRMRNKASGANLFQAQREYFDWLSRNDPNAWLLLDPVVSVQPDGLLFEVFSKDEGSYARLQIDWSAIEQEGEPVYGTTNIDFSQQLFDGLQRMRTRRKTRIEIGQDAVRFQTEAQPEVLEKQIRLPNTWLRGFLQVQSAATLPAVSFTIAPVDLYNVLRQLRLHADQKKGGRAIRAELAPGEIPRLVLEPWETVVNTSAEVYKGRLAQVVRIWGRRRLMMLARLMPFIESVDVHLLGTGLPSFYVLRCGAFTVTMGLTGFTSANWSQALGLDSLLPRTSEVSADLAKIVTFMEGKWIATPAELEEALGLKGAALRHAVQLGCQQGKLIWDLAKGVYRFRPLLAEGLDPDKLEFRNERERQAHDLLAKKGGSVEVLSENRLPGVGVQYVANVVVDADRREYRCELTIDDEGRVRRADCTSPFFRKHQLKEGPSAPLIALRMKVAELQAARAAERGQGTIQYETRMYVKRHKSGEDVYQVSLEQTQVKVRWGQRSQERLRSQSLAFNSVDAAREAYFARIAELERRGFMDATAG
jgi:predicted DNA-binding WGR domain protein